MLEIKRFGDRGILVNFEQRIESEINQRVIQLSERLISQHPSGLLYTIPAYCSLTIQYDPKLLSFAQLSKSIEDLIAAPTDQVERNTRKLDIPVCYDPEFGLDLEAICRDKDISPDRLIEEHTKPDYRVYMLGFLPGFVYLGKLPNTLACKRRSDPRLRVPQQSVAIAGEQTGIYPSEAPGGWNIIGRTPLPLIEPDKPEPFLFRAGDLVRFRSVDKDQFKEIEEAVFAGNYEIKVSHG